MYALTQPERELLSNQYPDHMQHVHDQITSVQFPAWLTLFTSQLRFMVFVWPPYNLFTVLNIVCASL